MLQLTKRIIKTSKKEVYEHLQGVGAMNPNFDGNALAWYDGDLDLTNTQWDDQSGGGHDIVFSNTPTIVPLATPLKQAVRFNGTNESGVVATPVTTQPITLYIVMNIVSWNINDAVFDDGVTNLRKFVQCHSVTPNLLLGSGGFGISSDPDTAVGTFGIMTGVIDGASSEFRTNLNAAVSGNEGGASGAGLTLGSRQDGSNFGNVEIAYLILRTGADSTIVQTRIITWLGAICGITV